MIEKKCIVCGSPFKPLYANQQTCSQECSKKNHAEKRAEYMGLYRHKKSSRKRKSGIDKTLQEANKQGLSYGQYKAQQWLKEQREEDGET